jgi:hypothetical protein
LRRIALALTALALVGCESTQEQSARLERIAKRETAEAAHRKTASQRALSITRPSTVIHVLSATVVHSSEGAAVAVILHNSSPTASSDVPIEVAVEGAGGAKLYTNATPGLSPTLVAVPLVGAQSSAMWVDDQVQTPATPLSVHAEVGEGERASGQVPSIQVAGAHLGEGTAEGSVVNRSGVDQHEVVVYALARRGGSIVAAGRAVVPQLAPGASERFQAFLIGEPRGAQLEVSAQPTTLG